MMNAYLSSFNAEKQNNIDLLRMIAVSTVVIHHAQHVFGGSFPFFGTYGGEFGVQLFFVISGYLIASSWERSTWQEYAIHRVCRILPAYLFFMFVVGALTGSINFNKIQNHPIDFLLNIFLLQHLSPRALMQFDTLHVTWTLTVEVLWYLTAPLFIFFLTKYSNVTLIGVMLISSVWSFLSSKGLMNFIYPEINQPASVYLFISNHFVAQVCFFVAGTWFYVNKERFKTLNPLTLILSGVVIFLLRPYYSFFSPIFITGVGLLCFLMAVVFLPPLKNKLIYLISESSYSIYLIHFPVLMYVNERIELHGIDGVALSVILILLISVFSYQLIERSGIRFGKNINSLTSKSFKKHG